MRIYAFLFLLGLAGIVSAGVPGDEGVSLIRGGKKIKTIKMDDGFFKVLPRYSEIDASGAATILSYVIERRKGVLLSEEEALFALFEKGDRKAILERNGVITMQDMKNVLSGYGIGVSYIPMRDRVVQEKTATSDIETSYKRIVLVGNERAKAYFPLVAVYYASSGRSHYILIESADDKYIYALSPEYGRMAMTESEFVDSVPAIMVLK